MNLKENPTKQQLKNLFASQDDKAGHHVIWVSTDGAVNLDVIPDKMAPIGFEKSLNNRMQFRLETMVADNGYVGPLAAKDDQWMDRVYAALVDNYANGVSGYIDVY